MYPSLKTSKQWIKHPLDRHVWEVSCLHDFHTHSLVCLFIGKGDEMFLYAWLSFTMIVDKHVGLFEW